MNLHILFGKDIYPNLIELGYRQKHCQDCCPNLNVSHPIILTKRWFPYHTWFIVNASFSNTACDRRMRFINAIVQWRWLTPRGWRLPGKSPPNLDMMHAPTKTLHWRRGFDWKLDLNIIGLFHYISLLPLCLVNYLLLPVHFFSQFRTLIFVSEQGAPARVPVLPNEYSISSNATRRCTPYYLVESLPGVTVPLAASMFFSSDLGIDYGKNRLMLTGWVFYCVYQKELL